MRFLSLLILLPIHLIAQDAFTITFGSCNKQNKSQAYWNTIGQQQANVFIWLGDNIYGDSEDMNVIRQKYQMQLDHPEYQAFKSNTEIIGVWDDHDYGKNDAGIEFSKKSESKEELLRFLEYPANHRIRSHEGMYESYMYNISTEKSIQVILLDGRWWKTAVQKAGKVNLPTVGAELLGEAQWVWLDSVLAHSTADAHIIGCGIQFWSADHPWEKWSNFPDELSRFEQLIRKHQPNNLLLISGDRHIAEFSEKEVTGYGKVVDMTSSALNTSFKKQSKETNAFRVGKLIQEDNFGLIRIVENENGIGYELEIRGKNGVIERLEL